MITDKPFSPSDLPVLTDVIVPGQRAARGQTLREQRRASDVSSQEPDEDDDTLYTTLLQADALELDVEGAIDRVLDRYAEMLREDLREEFENLLARARASLG